MDDIVKGLLNGRKPPEQYFAGDLSYKLAKALATKIDQGVAPSLCAHAMCGSASVGNVAVVQYLASLPKEKFNKAYNFSEPLRRAIRSFLRNKDHPRRGDFRECAKLLISAKADLFHPDKNSPSGMTAARILKDAGNEDAVALLKELTELQEKCSSKAKVKVEQTKSSDSSSPSKKRKIVERNEVEVNTASVGGDVLRRGKRSRKL